MSELRRFCRFFNRMIENDQKRSFGDHEIKRLSGGPRKKFGGPKRPARTALEDGCDEKKRFSIFQPRFGPYLSAFFGFFQKSKNRRFCFAIFSMKNASTEKTLKYTTMKSTEKQIKCTSPIFYFRNFVTEIFAQQFQKFSIFFKKVKTGSFVSRFFP